MTKDEMLFQRRLLDLADTAWQRGVVLFTDFLSLNEQSIYHMTLPQFSGVQTRMFGGYEGAERLMLQFVPEGSYYDASYGESDYGHAYPITCLQIAPLNAKFSDALSHRDYLGALMNLGIERSLVGDILVREQDSLLFCCERISDYLCSELTRIKHTSVYVKPIDFPSLSWMPKTETILGTVASVRLDSLCSLAFKTSRSSLTSLIEGGKVFVNGKLITSNGYHVKDLDLISARGYGKFRYVGERSQTKKGRCLVEIEKFV